MLGLTADERQILEGLHAFIDRDVMPIQRRLAAEFSDPRRLYDQSGKEVAAVTEARREVRMKSAEAGFYTMFLPASMGGMGLGVRLWFACYQSLYHRYGAPAYQLPYYVISFFASGPHEFWDHAQPALKAEVLPRLMSGELQGAFGLSEPDAGSDVWMMKTKAVRDGDNWILNGSKQWTSWSPTADFVMVFAITDPDLAARRRGGISCFYVPTSTPGYRFESVLKLFGHVGGDEGILSFTDAVIPDAFRVGPLHQALDLALLGIVHGRFSNAALALGLARWALEKALEYAKLRVTFGKVIGEHQTIQNYLAECATKLYAGHAMAMDCATKADAGRDIRAELSMAKLFCTRAGFEIIDTCMQIHGGMGLANETKLVDAWCFARLTHVTEGTSEIQLRTISQSLLKARVDLSFA